MKTLKFNGKPELEALKNLKVNGAEFIRGKGWFGNSEIIMNIPHTFRFETRLEIAQGDSGSWDLILSQFLTRGPDYWEMQDGLGRIGFRNPEIREQLEDLCNDLVTRGLAYWAEDVTA